MMKTARRGDLPLSLGRLGLIGPLLYLTTPMWPRLNAKAHGASKTETSLLLSTYSRAPFRTSEVSFCSTDQR